MQLSRGLPARAARAGTTTAAAPGRRPLVLAAAATPAAHRRQRSHEQQARRRRGVIAVVRSTTDDEAGTAATTTTTTEQEQQQQQEQAAAAAAAANGNGASSPAAAAAAAGTAKEEEKKDDDDAPKHLSWVPDTSALPPLAFKGPLQGGERALAQLRLFFALPWRRFKGDAALAFKLEGDVADTLQGRFAPGFSLPQITDALEKAAADPRIKGIAVEIGPLAVGWAKAQELRRHIAAFRAAAPDKFAVCYMKNAGEKEYYIATAFGSEVYLAPGGNLRLAGFASAGTFLRGVLEKVGIEPQVVRIGAYKSAGDQLLRRDMSDAQREQTTALLDDVYAEFARAVAEARGKSVEDVAALLDRGVFDNEVFLREGWVDGLKYEDEVIELLKPRTGGKDDEVRRVGLSRYAKCGRSAFGLDGKQRIAVVRANGAILGKASGAAGGGGSITPDALIPKLRALAKNKQVKGVVLRVDSPGGDALASDLMWREVTRLARKKPVVACMGDVAASGGYYLSFGAQAIVAMPLTVTGSIGVVTGKFNTQALQEKIGVGKTLLSRGGRYAELLAADNRPFTPEEAALFEEAAQHAYRQFRDKAAAGRNMSVDEMQAVAQGRVWSGTRALEQRLVDCLGGLHEAVELVKQAAGIDASERVAVVEVSRARSSPLALLAGGGASAGAAAALALGALARGAAPGAALAQAVGGAALQQALGGLLPNGLSPGAGLELLQQVALGQPLCLLTEVDAASLVATPGATKALAGAAPAAAAGGAFVGGEPGVFDDVDGADGGPAAALLARLGEAIEEALL